MSIAVFPKIVYRMLYIIKKQEQQKFTIILG